MSINVVFGGSSDPPLTTNWVLADLKRGVIKVIIRYLTYVSGYG